MLTILMVVALIAANDPDDGVPVPKPHPQVVKTWVNWALGLDDFPIEGEGRSRPSIIPECFAPQEDGTRTEQIYLAWNADWPGVASYRWTYSFSDSSVQWLPPEERPKPGRGYPRVRFEMLEFADGTYRIGISACNTVAWGTFRFYDDRLVLVDRLWVGLT